MLTYHTRETCRSLKTDFEGVMQQRMMVCKMVVRRGFVVVQIMLQGELGHQVKSWRVGGEVAARH
jgi:hypothetical protein